MIIIRTAIKSIFRHLRQSMLFFIVCIVTTQALFIYIASIYSTYDQLKKLDEIIPINAVVTNQDGSKTMGLSISDKIIGGLENSTYVKDLMFTVNIFAGIGNFSIDEWKENLNISCVGINSLNTLKSLNPESIIWHGDDNREMFELSETVCLVDNSLMQQRGWNLNDVILLNMYYYHYDENNMLTYKQLEVLEFKIVARASLTGIIEQAMAPQILLPFYTLRETYHRQGVEFFADSASFSVANPIELNAFKEEMANVGLMPVDKNNGYFSVEGNNLYVMDEIFINAATQLKESFDLLMSFLPILIIALISIGYFVSYLVIQNISGEYAIFRLLGFNKKTSSRIYSTELAILTVLGCGFGLVLSWIYGAWTSIVGVIGFALFILCFMFGCCIALCNLSRTNVMITLSKKMN